MALTVRPATLDDVERIVQAYLDSAEHHARLDPERYAVPPVETVLARYRERLQPPQEGSPAAATFVAEEAGEIVGVVEVRLDRSPDAMDRGFAYCHIVEIAVRATHRSRGIGARLLDAAEGWGRELGATFGVLEHLAVNTRAADFYRRQGYRGAAIIELKRL